MRSNETQWMFQNKNNSENSYKFYDRLGWHLQNNVNKNVQKWSNFKVCRFKSAPYCFYLF